MDTGNTSIGDKLDMLGAALMTASAGHGLLCIATLPGLIETPHTGILGGALKVLGILWTTAGAVAAGYVTLRAYSIFKGRDYEKAQKAALGALVLPFIGLTGGVTAFALLPIGGAAWWLLRQPDWKAAFAHDVLEAPSEAPLPEHETFAEETREEEAREPAIH